MGLRAELKIDGETQAIVSGSEPDRVKRDILHYAHIYSGEMTHSMSIQIIKMVNKTTGECQ